MIPVTVFIVRVSRSVVVAGPVVDGAFQRGWPINAFGQIQDRKKVADL